MFQISKDKTTEIADTLLSIADNETVRFAVRQQAMTALHTLDVSTYLVKDTETTARHNNWWLISNEDVKKLQVLFADNPVALHILNSGLNITDEIPSDFIDH